MKIPSVILALSLVAGPSMATAQDDRITEVRVQFDRGAESATRRGSITGAEIVDHVFRARAGQTAIVTLEADPPVPYFNLLPPGSEGEAVFLGSREGARFEGVLDASGDWTARVYQMGAARDEGGTTAYALTIAVLAEAGDRAGAEVPAAPEDGGPRHWKVTAVSSALNMRDAPSTAGAVVMRLEPGRILSNLGCEEGAGRVWCDVQPVEGGPRGFVAAEFLSPAEAPDGGVASGENDSAARAGRGDFDATGPMPCAQHRGQPMNTCQFGVARAGGGDATVVVTHPDGFRRALFFTRGEFVGADASQAAGGFDTSVEMENGLYRVRVDDERYEVTDSVIFGG